MQDNKNRKRKKSTGLVFVFANTIIFLLASLFFLFGTLIEVHYYGSKPKKIVGIELLIGAEYPTAVKSGWLFVGFWVVCFLLSSRASHSSESGVYDVVLSVAAAILLINTVQQVEISLGGHSSYAIPYYIALGAIFLNAIIGYMRTIIQRYYKAVASKTTNSQIHINIINAPVTSYLPSDKKMKKT